MALQLSLVARMKGAVAVAASGLSAIRAKQARIEVIARTSFPLTAYALFDSITGSLVLLLVVYMSSTPLAGYVTVGLFTFLFSYM